MAWATLSQPCFPGDSDGKKSACNVGDLCFIPGSGRSLGEGNSYPLKYSCLGNPMGRGAWWAIVHGVTKSWTQLSNQYLCNETPVKTVESEARVSFSGWQYITHITMMQERHMSRLWKEKKQWKLNL